MTFLVLLTFTMVAVTWVALELTLPNSSRCRRWTHALWWHVTRRHRPKHDPFDALRVQTRLHVVAAEIRTIEADPTTFARVHRLDVARAAYDDLLHEACELAGVDVSGSADDPHDDAERWREEQELTARGWSW